MRVAALLPVAFIVNIVVAHGQTAQPIRSGFGAGAYPPGTYRTTLREVVEPIYPRDAIRAALEGDVEVEAVIETDGAVGNVRVTKAPVNAASLEQAAIAAVRKWKFDAVTDRGKRVRVVVRLVVSFFLHKPGTKDGPPFTESGMPPQRSSEDPSTRTYTADTPGIVGPRVTRSVEPKYTREAMREKITGEVELELVIDTNGRVDRARMLKSLDSRYGLDEQAFIAARQWQFTPARMNGTPVPITVRIVLEFKLH